MPFVVHRRRDHLHPRIRPNVGYFSVLEACKRHSQIPRYRHYRSTRPRAVSESLASEDIPHVTIIRPIRGLEPDLYHCLAATFQQTYPQSKLTVCFCLPSRQDPALSVVDRLLVEWQTFNTQVFFEDEDPIVQAGGAGLGPNPKIRNISGAYREAKSDIIWIVDCNVWVAKGVAGRMVDLLCGFTRSGIVTPNKFVHQLPLVVDITDEHGGLLDLDPPYDPQPVSTGFTASDTLKAVDFSHQTPFKRIWQRGGGRLEELFLASAHGKWYTAINTLLLAPCIVGKSNMFRRSHLDQLTSQDTESRRPGVDFFSDNICEDHLIGDLLWKNKVHDETGPRADTLGKHAMLFGDLAIQPMAGMNIGEYIARRVRWLRVRKFTVTLATLVEPGTESFLCSLYGAYAVTTLSWFHDALGIPPTWSAFAAFWLLSVSIWAAMDCTLYSVLHSMASVETDEDTPAFVRRRNLKRTFREWLLAWLGRELLSLPIWLWAVWGGTNVTWRGQRFRVGMDMRVHALDAKSGNVSPKARQE